MSGKYSQKVSNEKLEKEDTLPHVAIFIDTVDPANSTFVMIHVNEESIEEWLTMTSIENPFQIYRQRDGENTDAVHDVLAAQCDDCHTDGDEWAYNFYPAQTIKLAS